MTAIPNLTVILPADAWQTQAMTAALVQHEGPVYVRMGRGAVPDVYGPDGMTGLSPTFSIGKAIELMTGKDVLIIATGETVALAYQAGLRLAEEGLSATVLDLPTLMPLDEKAILGAATRCKVVISVEEHSMNGGLGALVASLLCENQPRPMKKIAFPNENLVTGTSSQVFLHYGLSVENIVSQARLLLECGGLK